MSVIVTTKKGAINVDTIQSSTVQLIMLTELNVCDGPAAND